MGVQNLQNKHKKPMKGDLILILYFVILYILLCSFGFTLETVKIL